MPRNPVGVEATPRAVLATAPTLTLMALTGRMRTKTCGFDCANVASYLARNVLVGERICADQLVCLHRRSGRRNTINSLKTMTTRTYKATDVSVSTISCSHALPAGPDRHQLRRGGGHTDEIILPLDTLWFVGRDRSQCPQCGSRHATLRRCSQSAGEGSRRGDTVRLWKVDSRQDQADRLPQHSATGTLERHDCGRSSLSEHISSKVPNFARERAGADTLFQGEHDHVGGLVSSSCDSTKQSAKGSTRG